MTHWMRLACCMLPAACGPAPIEVGAPGPAGGTPAPAGGAAASAGAIRVPAGGEACADTAAGVGYPHALLRLGCGGEVLPGRAVWSRDGSEVTLGFPEPAGGPTGAELVEAWPPLTEPPWLGHRVDGITVLSGGRVAVRFGGLPRGPGTEPERLFADHRLSGVPFAPPEGDARDAIDAGLPVLTRHDASVEYARSLGRPVQLVAFDQLYLVVFAGEAGDVEAAELGRAIAADWARWGAEGARKVAAVTWTGLTGQCDTPLQAGDAGAVRPRRASANPTVSYREGDQPGLQLAQRIVSATVRRDRYGATVRGLTGSAARLSVRAAGGTRPAPAETDVAAVFRVQAGPGHPCSLHAEVLRELEDWQPLRAVPRASVLLIGEAAAFEIGQAAPFMRPPRRFTAPGVRTALSRGPPGWLR